jgi:large subunit ribosomal protein L2
VPAVVERSSTTRTAPRNLALLKYADGERAYISRQGPEGGRPGRRLRDRADRSATACRCATSRSAPRCTASNAAGQGRPAGAPPARRPAGSARGAHATLRLRSGEMRKVHADCRAVIGVGRQRRTQPAQARQGRRDALARCPSDRPRRRHEPGRPPARRRRRAHLRRSSPGHPWGVPTKGYKTRKNKRTDGMIVRRRGSQVS